MDDIQASRIIGMLQGYSTSYLLYTACEAGIFNVLYEEKKSLHNIAIFVDIDEDILFRILRPLVAMNLIELDDELFSLSELGARISKYHENSLENTILFVGRECMKCWANLYEALSKKTIPFVLSEKQAFFEKHGEEGDSFLSFNEMMQTNSFNLDISNYLKEAGEKEIKTIVDIGGGAGEIILKFLSHYQSASGIIVDLEHVKGVAENNIEKYGMHERCSFVSGDFFTSSLGEADIFILSRILHDWDDEQSLKLLNNVIRSMNDYSRLLVIERILPDELNGRNVQFFMNDLHIWSICGGKERSLKEFTLLFGSVGLVIRETTKLNSNESVLEIGLKNEI